MRLHSKIVSSFLILAVWASPAYSLLDPEKDQTGSEAKKAVSDPTEPGPKPEYVPGEIIVKLKDGSASLLGIENALPDDFVLDVSQASIPGPLGEVLQKHKATLTPVYKQLHGNIRKLKKDARTLHDEMLAKFPKRSKRAPQRNLTIAEDLKNTYLVKIPKEVTEDVSKILQEYSKLEDVAYASLNYISKAFLVPNDPYYSSSRSWTQDYDDLWGHKKLDVEHAWDITQGEGVTVAVVDTGVDYTHPDLEANIWVNKGEVLNGIDDDENGFVDDIRGWDFAYRDNDPSDLFGHGTHCAGTIGSVGNNMTGTVGIAFQSKIMAVKGLNDSGSAPGTVLANAMTYAVDNGADVLSLSWGGVGSSPSLEDAAAYARSLGVVVIAAAGNSNQNVSAFSPANIESIIAVAASTQQDQKASFSNFGKKIAVSAPGSGYVDELGGGQLDLYNILSTMPDNSVIARDVPRCRISSGYWRLAGTSMACPHVAAEAALVLATYPGISIDEVEGRIIATADPFPVAPPVPMGSGRINAYKAVTAEPFPYFLLRGTEMLDDEGNNNRIPQSGERIKLIVKVKNIFGGASSVRAILRAQSPWITIKTDSSDYGDIAPGEEKTNADNPFIFEIGDLPNHFTEVDFEMELVTSTGKTQILELRDILLGSRQLPVRTHSGPGITDVFPDMDGRYIAWYQGGPSFQAFISFLDLDNDLQTEVSDSNRGISRPRVSGDRIIRSEDRGNNWDVYLYEISTGTDYRLTTDPGFQMDPDISGDWIVWRSGNELVLHDLTTGESTRPGLSGWSPRISGNHIVYRNLSSELYGYDIKHGTSTLIASSNLSWDYDVSDDKIVWNSVNAYGTYDVMLYDFATGKTTQITQSRPDFTTIEPVISENYVVWREGQPGLPDQRLLYMNLKTGNSGTLLPQISPGRRIARPSIYQNKVVWSVVIDLYVTLYMTELPES